MRRDYCLIVCLFFLACSLPVGCGGGSSITGDPRFGQDRFRPNYGGDLVSANYFPSPVITYRITQPGDATDIYGKPTVAAFATNGQADSIRGGMAKWEAALSGRRQIVEVPTSDTTAMIDVMVQTPENFNQAGVLEQLGNTANYWSDRSQNQYGRSVVRLRNDLTERQFRYVALHEEGHALGIDGHSRRFGDVMYAIGLPGSLTPIVELSRRDVNTVAALYEGR